MQEKTSFISHFESSLVLDEALQAALAGGDRLGVAVSGGADSIALLTALCHRLGKERLAVITVNHNIRPEVETAGDAAFVAACCQELEVDFCRVDLPRGLVEETAGRRGRGTEEAARFLRYQAFEDFAREKKLCALALAHNQNDQLETLLMRFLQGSGASGGIAGRRGIFIRPLLPLSRADIERYLREQGMSWRTDATNADTRYLRNAIRHQLLPALDRTYPGWRRAALQGAEKAREDCAALEAEAACLKWAADPAGGCYLPVSAFYALSPAVRRRLLYRALGELDTSGRFPYSAVKAVCADSFAAGGRIEAHGILCAVKKARLSVKKSQKKATESGFVAILETPGRECRVDGAGFSVSADGVLLYEPGSDGGCVAEMEAALETEAAACLEKTPRAVCRVALPVCIRSLQAGDAVTAADGSERSVGGLLSSWHIPAEDRAHVPLVQEVGSPGQPIVCVLGSACAAPDWIAKERKL